MESVPAVPTITVGTRVSYADVANPLRTGVIVGEHAGQWLVTWDGDDAATLDVDGVTFHTSVTKPMLQRAAEQAATMRAERRGRRGGWGVEPTTCTTCGRPADDGYLNVAADEACLDACHSRSSRDAAFARAEAATYYALCDRADALGIPTSLDDPRSPRTVTSLMAHVAAAELAQRGEHGYVVTLPNGDEAEADTADDLVRAAQVLVGEAGDHGCSTTWLKRNLRAMVAGRYDGQLTERCAS